METVYSSSTMPLDTLMSYGIEKTIAAEKMSDAGAAMRVEFLQGWLQLIPLKRHRNLGIQGLLYSKEQGFR